MNRKQLILVVLLVGLALALAYAWWATPRQARVAERGGIPGSAVETREGQTAVAAAPGVRFDLLGEEPRPFPGARRDIFSFYVEPVRSEPPPPPPPAPKPPPPAPAPTPPRPVVQQPLASFTFLGFLEVAGETIVFVSSAEEIYLVREGERFGRNQEFEVADIEDQILTVKQTGQARPTRIFLVEKDKPDASVSSPARLSPLPPLPEEPSAAAAEMSAPARRPRSGGVPEQAPMELDGSQTQGGTRLPRPAVDLGNAEGDMNGTNQ